MKAIREHLVAPAEAALWWLGQAGYVVRAGDTTVAIDPYLTDSAAANAPEFTRLFPPPIAPEELRADICVITHDHLDHLDPETIRRYPAKAETWFVAPHLTALHLQELGVPANRVVRLDAGEISTLGGVEVRGVFALPTGADVLDTTGYLLRFDNGPRTAGLEACVEDWAQSHRSRPGRGEPFYSSLYWLSALDCCCMWCCGFACPVRQRNPNQALHRMAAPQRRSALREPPRGRHR